MKLVVKISLFLSVCILSFSCSKEAEHTLTIKNELTTTANRLRFGDIKFENLKANSTSVSRKVLQGDFAVTAIIYGQSYKSEEIRIEGEDGNCFWVITIETLDRISFSGGKVN